MYAIIETGNKQYKIQEGDIIDTELLEGDKDSKISFDNVLLVVDNDKLQIGKPLVKNVKVTGKILKHDKSDKVVVFRYKNKINYRKTRGHRQPYTQVQIEKIQGVK